MVVIEFKIKFLEESWQVDGCREGHEMITVLKRHGNESDEGLMRNRFLQNPRKSASLPCPFKRNLQQFCLGSSVFSPMLLRTLSWDVQAFVLVPYLNLET